MRRLLIYMLLIFTSCATFAQTYFDIAIKRKHIAEYKIKEKSYYEYTVINGKVLDSTLTMQESFDPKGYLTETKSRYLEIVYNYDANGNLTKEIHKIKNKEFEIILFKYDLKGNMIEQKTFVGLPESRDKYDLNKSKYISTIKYDYNVDNELIRGYSINSNGLISQYFRYEYKTKGLGKDVKRIVNRYYEKDTLKSIEVFYKNNSSKRYIVEKGKRKLDSESFFNVKHQIIKATEYNYIQHHRDDRSIRDILKSKEAPPKQSIRSVANRFYVYNKNGDESELLTYKNEQLAEEMKFYYKYYDK